MPETTLRAADGNGHMFFTLDGSDGLGWTIRIPAEPPIPLVAPKGKCPYPRSLSKVTCEYSLQLDYEAFEILIAALYDIWEGLEVKAGGSLEQPHGDMFEALIKHVTGLQAWTGWGGAWTGETNP